MRLLCLLALALPLGAATIQIVVRDDGGAIVQNVVIDIDPDSGTGDQALASVQDWRDSQKVNERPEFPNTVVGHKAFWDDVLMTPLRRMVDLFPYSGLAAKRTTRETAETDRKRELSSVFN